MSVLVWNVWGIQRLAARDYLELLIRDHRPLILVLLETHLTAAESERFFYKWRRHWSASWLAGSSRSGGILFLWKHNKVSCKHLFSSSQAITMFISMPGFPAWVFTSVYASIDATIRNLLWKSLDVSSLREVPWLCAGDFNCITIPEDKVGGRPFHLNGSGSPLADLLVSIGLVDLGFSGPRFTWSNNRSGLARIMSRLDRAYANHPWFRLGFLARISHLPRASSDHAPILIGLSLGTQAVRRPQRGFIYEHFWREHPDIGKTVANWWVSRGLSSFSEKLSSLTVHLEGWGRSTFGSLERSQRDTMRAISLLEVKEAVGALLAHEVTCLQSLHNKLAALNRQLHVKWWSKSRAAWIVQGDKNTKYFHSITRMRSRINEISQLVMEGVPITEKDSILGAFELFYRDLWATPHQGAPVGILDRLPW